MTRKTPALIPFVLLLLCAFPTHAQEHAPTLAESLAWINQQTFQFAVTNPELRALHIDPVYVLGLDDDGCSGSQYDAHYTRGCLAMSGDATECGFVYVRAPVSLSAGPLTCASTIVLTATAVRPEHVRLFSPATFTGAVWCRQSQDVTGTARVQMRVSIALADFAGANNVPRTGSPSERFWLFSSNDREAFRVERQTLESYLGQGEFDDARVSRIGFTGNSPVMAARLTHAFQHIADLCASARPSEPF